jgi:hypothetical protein
MPDADRAEKDGEEAVSWAFTPRGRTITAKARTATIPDGDLSRPIADWHGASRTLRHCTTGMEATPFLVICASDCDSKTRRRDLATNGLLESSEARYEPDFVQILDDQLD